MHCKDDSSSAENQEQELTREVAAATLRATKAEYRLALLELALAEPSLAGMWAEVFRRDTSEELFSEPIQREPSHAKTN